MDTLASLSPRRAHHPAALNYSPLGAGYYPPEPGVGSGGANGKMELLVLNVWKNPSILCWRRLTPSAFYSGVTCLRRATSFPDERLSPWSCALEAAAANAAVMEHYDGGIIFGM